MLFEALVKAGCFWSEESTFWMYEVFVRRGKNKGYWSVSESGLEKTK